RIALAMSLEFDFDSWWRDLEDIVAHKFKNALWFLVGDQPAAYFSPGLSRNDGLEAGAGVPAEDAVDFQCGSRACAFCQRITRFAPRLRRADVACPFFRGQVLFLKLCPLRIIEGQNVVIKAGNRNAAICIVQSGDNFGDHLRRVMDNAAVYAA